MFQGPNCLSKHRFIFTSSGDFQSFRWAMKILNQQIELRRSQFHFLEVGSLSPCLSKMLGDSVLADDDDDDDDDDDGNPLPPKERW